MFAYGPADAAASFKSRLILPLWYRLTQVIQEKRQLNGCSSSSNEQSVKARLVKIGMTNITVGFEQGFYNKSVI